MIKRSVTENGMVADLFHDGSGQPRKAILLLGGSEGGKVWSSIGTRKVVNQLASRGYTLLSLAYFKSPGLPPILEEVPLEYFEKATGWLAHQPDVQSAELAIIGVSKGAEAALLLGSMDPKIKAVVALSPSSVVWQSIPKMGGERGSVAKSSWSYKGKGLTFVTDGLTSWNMGTAIRTLLFGALRKAYEQALLDQSQVEAATIPVEKIQGAVLLMSGKRDNMWPSSPMCEQIMGRLAARGFAHPYQHIACDAGHSNYILKEKPLQAIYRFLKDNYA